MDMSEYDVIKNICMTGKSQEMYHDLGKVTFVVSKMANKSLIRDAVERIWKVKVEKVRVINLPRKKKTFARKTFLTGGKKKAIVSLKQGYKIDLPGQFETMGSSSGKSGDSKGS
jgi:large subunit ribosomal protein L23